MISREAWLSALAEASDESDPSDPNVLTIPELCEVFGKKHAATVRAANILVESGRAERTTKRVRMVNGYWRAVPAYRLKQ